MKTRLIFGILLLFSGCGPTGPATTHTGSSQFLSLGEKKAFLERYVTFRRTYEALDFHVDYFNGDGGFVAGPSEWDVRLVAKVPASELRAWIPQGVTQQAGDVAWLKSIATTLDLSGITEWYPTNGRIIGIDRKQNLVVYRSWKN